MKIFLFPTALREVFNTDISKILKINSKSKKARHGLFFIRSYKVVIFYQKFLTTAS